MRNLLLISVLLFSATTLAQDSPQVMLKIVVHLDSPGIPQDAFIRQPKVIYRAGNRYCRVEETLDAEHGLQQLMIFNEPDAWIVNLVDKKGQHIVDSGPSLTCHLPIFSGPPPGLFGQHGLRKVGLGVRFRARILQENGCHSPPGPVLQTKQTTSYVLDFGDIQLTLFAFGPSQRPLVLGRTYQHIGGIFRYSDYGLLPFDPKLFSKPEGVTIEEPNPDSLRRTSAADALLFVSGLFLPRSLEEVCPCGFSRVPL